MLDRLKGVAEHELAMGLAEFGVDFQTPHAANRPSWRRYLGLDPEGHLDRPLLVERVGSEECSPIWKWFRVLSRRQIEDADLSAAIRSRLSPVEILDLCRDATYMIYALPNEDGLAPSARSSLLDVLPDELGPRAEAADIDGIRDVLKALHELKGWDLKAAGSKGGPMLSGSPPDAHMTQR